MTEEQIEKLMEEEGVYLSPNCSISRKEGKHMRFQRYSQLMLRFLAIDDVQNDIEEWDESPLDLAVEYHMLDGQKHQIRSHWALSLIPEPPTVDLFDDVGFAARYAKKG